MGNHAAGFFARQDLFGRPYGGVKENNIQMKALKDCDAYRTAIFVK